MNRATRKGDTRYEILYAKMHLLAYDVLHLVGDLLLTFRRHHQLVESK
jgi:hypothetical protein